MSRRWVRSLALVALLLCLALAGWFLAGQVRAWHHLNAGRDALDRNEVQSARRHLELCLQAWPSSAEVCFLAARAARRCGDLAEASRLLQRASELGWVRELIDLETALSRVHAGELHPSEGYLRDCLAKGHPDSLLILEILTPAYLRDFRLRETHDCATLWTELAPDDARPWTYRGIVAERRRNRKRAREAYAEAVRLDPGKSAVRLSLVRLLLDANLRAEAAPHLAKLREEHPDDPEVAVQLARQRDLEGKAAEAIKLLDEALARAPGDPTALYLRGKIELSLGRPKQAAPFLRKAASLPGADYEVLYNLVKCLRLVGTPEEVKEWEDRSARMLKDLDRLSALMKLIAEKPDEPDFRREAGELCIRNNMEQEGVRWLVSALVQDPAHAASHLALANHYERVGQPALAARHREMARGRRVPDASRP